MTKQMMDVPVAMRDGVILSTDIRLPSAGGRFPVLLRRTPYNNVSYGEPEVSFLRTGWAVVAQDCRGRFDSDGRFNPLRGEEEDGCDTIAWIKAQPWCDGRIAMIGGSYTGLTQFAPAIHNPPGLKAIAPFVMSMDNFRSIIYYDGVPNLSLAMRWGVGIAGRSAQNSDAIDWPRVYKHLPLVDMDEETGYRLDHVRDWFAHPVRDSYWTSACVEDRLTKVNIPCLIVGGWYDLYARDTARNFTILSTKGDKKARGKHRLIIGPWVHGVNTRSIGQVDFGEGAVIGLDDLQLRWHDHWVRGMKNGIDKEAPVRIFVMGTNVWRDENEWPLKRARSKSLFLASGGKANSLNGDGVLLSDKSSGKAADKYTYDPENPVPTTGGGSMGTPNGPTDQCPIERRDDVLVYTGKPLTKPLEVTGEVRAVIYVSSDAVDTDFVARLCDVYPDGRSMLLCDGIARMRFREGFDHEVMMKPGKVYELEIDMAITSNVFLPGHSIRLEITSSCFPRWARNLNTGEHATEGTHMVTASQTIHHSKRYPSRLILPVISKGM